MGTYDSVLCICRTIWASDVGSGTHWQTYGNLVIEDCALYFWSCVKCFDFTELFWFCNEMDIKTLYIPKSICIWMCAQCAIKQNTHSYNCAATILTYSFQLCHFDSCPGSPGCRNIRSGGDTATPSQDASSSWYATYVVFRSFKHPPPIPKLDVAAQWLLWPQNKTGHQCAQRRFSKPFQSKVP